MNRNLKKYLRLLLLAVGLIGLAVVLRQMLLNSQGEQSYTEAAQLAFRPQAAVEIPQPQQTETLPPEVWIPASIEEEDPHLETLKALDLEALRAVNPHVIGWILIPETKINYPLMQGEDNDYYLKHTWEGKRNAVGSIFLECQSSPDLTDFNTIVYGHNMNNGSMFAGLRKYSSEWYRQNHPYVYIASDLGVYRYEVFAFYQAPVDSLTYALSFPSDADRTAFLNHAAASAQQDSGIQPEITDRILTLSTCSGAGYTNRWVVQARLKMVKAP